jgi:enoyl-CoA hydratase
MSIIVERQGQVATVLLNRPEARNAVDRKTAAALAAAFRDFDADRTARGVVMAGKGGHFCAGADLKKAAAGRPNRIAPEGEAPMGPSRRLLGKPVIAAI